MALIKSDRVKETSTSTGATTFALAGAGTGYRTFSSVCAIGDTFYYAISNQSNGEWEAGLGTYSALNTLTRTAVHSSSNSGNLVTFTSGTKEVFLTLTARHLDRINDNGQSTAIGSKTSVVAVNDSATLPDLDLQFSELKTLTAKYGPTPSYSRASTGRYTNASGVLTSAAVNEPRFDHVYDGTSWVSKGLLIEEQRTNLCQYSEDFNSWGYKQRASFSSNAATSPDGNATADLFYPSATGTYTQVGIITVAVSSGTAYTSSVYAKASGKNWIYLYDPNGSKAAYFDLSNGTVGTVDAGATATITNVGNGWYRCFITATTTSTNGLIYIGVSDANGNDDVTASGTNGVYLWGAQVEAGSFATSYIPSLSNSSTTRSADVCQITGSAFTNLWNATEGTISLEQDLLSYSDPAADQRYFSIAASGNNPAFILNYDNGTSFFWYRYFSGLDQLVLPDVNSAFKVSLAFKTNDYATVLNGGTPVTSSTKTLPTTFERIDIGYQAGSTARSSWVQRVRYFRSRLDNTQLVNLSGGINTLAFKTVTGSGSVTVANEYSNINISVPSPLPIINGGTNATTQLAAVTNLVGNPPNDGGQYTLASKKTSGTPTFYWVDGTGYAPTLDLLFAADKSLTAYKGPTPTFSRASSGSFFDSTGVLRIQGYNILQYSEDFDNAYWTKSLTTILSNVAIAPNGQMTADKIVETQASGFHSVNRTTGVSSSASSTASIYLKAGERTFASFEIVDNFRAVINLTDGTVVSNTLASSTVTTENIGNGWWRVKYTTNSSAIGRLIVYPLPTSTFGSYSGDGASGIFAWGAQVESGSNANLYSATTNAANSAPRFNHTFNGTSWVSKGLLVEEQRTNQITSSETFSFTSGSVTSNTSTAPNGTTAGSTWTSSVGTFECRVIYNYSSTAQIVFSCYAKSGTHNFIQLRSNGAGYVNFNISNGTFSEYSGATGITTSVGNGWYRCTAILPASTVSAFSLNIVSSLSSARAETFVGNGTQTVILWGTQLELGSFPTSYIPTTTAAVTRSADVCQITGADFSSFWNASEGSFALEADSIGFASTGSNRFFYAAQSGGVAFYSLDIDPTLGLEYRVVNSSMQAQLTHTQPNAGVLFKHSLCYKVNDFASSLNGSAVATDTSGTLPTATSLGVGYFPGFNQHGNCHIARLRYYPTRLPNATLQVLST